MGSKICQKVQNVAKKGLQKYCGQLMSTTTYLLEKMTMGDDEGYPEDASRPWRCMFCFVAASWIRCNRIHSTYEHSLYSVLITY